MQPPDTEDEDTAQKPIGLPEALRDELDEEPARPRFRRPQALIETVSAPPPEAERLPLWAVFALTGAGVVGGTWIAVLLASAFRILGWI